MTCYSNLAAIFNLSFLYVYKLNHGKNGTGCVMNKAKWFAKQLASESLHGKHPRNRTTLTKYSRHYFPHKRPPQNVWPFEIFLSPRNLEIFQSVRTGHPKVTKYQRDNFPHKRPPQNVWPFKKFLSPKNVILSGQGIISLTKDRHKVEVNS